MLKEVLEINEAYQQFCDVLDPLADELLQLLQDKLIHMSLDDLREHQLLVTNYRKEYDRLRPILMETLPKLQSSEVAIAYAEGCRLFQRNLSGYMARDFHDDYIPVMCDAVKNGHEHTAWMFLQVLANNAPDSVLPLLPLALDMPRLQETALSIVGQLSVLELLPKVRELTKSDVRDVRSLAENAFRKLLEES